MSGTGEAMKHIVCFSGGKDSTALILWAKEHLGVPGRDFDTVFCDTGWEHPITAAYVQWINETVLNLSLITVRSDKYTGFEQLILERNMVPGVHSRFCTQELKVFPLHKYFETLDDEVTSYQGIRADESAKRARMLPRQWVDEGIGYWIERPLLQWTSEQVFALHEHHGVKPNPLYRMGHSRVGCWPCIMTGLGELKRIIQFSPELKPRLIAIEKKINDAADSAEYKSWFRAGTIPDRFCSKSVTTKDGRVVLIPAVEDVFAYLEGKTEDQIPLLPARACMSVYNLCE
jgi:3'-phosphoadenosine 5'-phosphosulfate sulfotransferase (PAPS reductase)/FAD synthetase